MGSLQEIDHVARVMKNDAQLPSVQVISPPKALSGRPPTLTQAKKMIVGHIKKPLRDVPLTNEALDDPKAFTHVLEQVSTQYRTDYLICSNPMRLDQFAAFLEQLRRCKSRLRLGIACGIDGKCLPPLQIEGGCENIVQIQWHSTGVIPDISLFNAFSRAGIWNHMVFAVGDMLSADCRAITRQPNILHSWQVTGAHLNAYVTANAYGQVSPLPGRPLWQSLSDPVDRFLFIDRLTKKRLLRMRVDDDNDSIYTVGGSLDYHFVEPAFLPDGYLDEICAMVAAGGTVAATHVRHNLKRAFLVAYVKERGVIVANSSLKHPRPAYIDMVRQKSGLDLTGFLERGYTSVRPEYRGMGIGTTLLEGLTRRAGEHKIFSVIGEDNAATKIIAKRNRTRKVATYFSDKAGKMVGIWMPEWMIESNDPKAL